MLYKFVLSIILSVILMNCPTCQIPLTEKSGQKIRYELIARSDDGKGGYFGERPEEFGVSGFGDLYQKYIQEVATYFCPRCSYIEKKVLSETGVFGYVSGNDVPPELK
jgi:hypothetical protein